MPVARTLLAVLCACGALAIVAVHPVAPGLLATGLVIHAALLWLRPALWLTILPALIPTLDLSPWTGWFLIGEAEPFALVTIAVLLLREPPAARDLWPTGWPGMCLALGVIVSGLGILIGVLAGPETPVASALTMLTPANAWRLTRGPLAALALLPFLIHRQRVHGDVARRLGGGMLAGICLVGALIALERGLFVDLLDFTSDYRAIGPFASMHFGGGHIGAYLAIALPFLVWSLPRGRPAIAPQVQEIAPGVRLTRHQDGPVRPSGDDTRAAMTARLVLGALAGVAAAYILAATFARAALVTTGVSVLVGVGLYVLARTRGGRRGTIAGIAWAAGGLAVLGGVVAVAVLTPRMLVRLTTVEEDMQVRQANWSGRLSLMGGSIPAHLFGMGTGTYPRVARMAPGMHQRPSDVAITQEGRRPVLRLHPGSALYLGQKVQVTPGASYRLTVDLRAPDGQTSLTVLLCEKWLLYSDACQSHSLVPPEGLNWRTAGVTWTSATMGRARFLGMARPVEFSLAVSGPNVVEVGPLTLTAANGDALLGNPAWREGLTHWFPTDDHHLTWQIKNQFLMLWFENGLLGLLVFLAVIATGIGGGLGAVLRGDASAAPVVAAMAGFLAAGLLDYLTTAPRLAMLLWLLIGTGLALRVPAQPVSGTIADGTGAYGTGRPPQQTRRTRGDRG